MEQCRAAAASQHALSAANAAVAANTLLRQRKSAGDRTLNLGFSLWVLLNF